LIKKNNDRKAQTTITREIFRFTTMTIFEIFGEENTFKSGKQVAILVRNGGRHNQCFQV